MFNVLVISALIGLLPAAIAQSKGRSFMLWWIYGAAIFIVALPHSLMLSGASGNGRVKCPHCAELILEEAKACRFCGRDVAVATVARSIAIQPERVEVTGQPALEESATTPESRPRITIEEGPSAFGQLPQAPGGFGSMTTTIVLTAVATIAALIAFGASGCPNSSPSMSRKADVGYVYLANDSYLRKSPRPTGELGPRLGRNTKVHFEGIQQGWYRIAMPNDTTAYYLPTAEALSAPLVEPADPTPTVASPSVSGLSTRESAEITRSARKVVNAMAAADALREINGPYSVIVGPRFFALSYETQRTVCQGVSIMRMESGQTQWFFLKDPTSRKKFGEFSDGKLVLD